MISDALVHRKIIDEMMLTAKVLCERAAMLLSQTATTADTFATKPWEHVSEIGTSRKIGITSFMHCSVCL